jgi:hypothetical protein
VVAVIGDGLGFISEPFGQSETPSRKAAFQGENEVMAARAK